MRAALVLAPILVMATAGASATIVESITVNPSAGNTPATLSAGATGSTTLGVSATSAQTTYSTPLALLGTTLAVDAQLGGWDMRLELLATSGFGLGSSVAVDLDNGTLTETQATITDGAITQSIGTAVALPASGSINVDMSGTRLLTGTATMDMQLILTPTGGNNPELRYDYGFIWE